MVFILSSDFTFTCFNIFQILFSQLIKFKEHFELIKNKTMIRFISCSIIRVFSSNNKPFYPFLLSPDYQLLQYPEKYMNKQHTLKIQTPNQYQISYDTLPKFLSKQIQTDKTLFIKEKQFLFIGRSNSGKSSLINGVFQDKNIARKAKKAGTTKFLHFHKIKGEDAYVVDAPGYGFAEMNKKRRNLWFGLVQTYIKISSRISQIFLCINFQHGLKSTDIEVLTRLSKLNIDIQIVMNKVDKVNEKYYMNQVQAINDAIRRLELPNINNRILACSTKSYFGLEFVRCRIMQAIQHSKQRNIDMNQDLLLEYLKDFRVSEVDITQKQQQSLSRPYVVRKLIYNSQLTKYLV